jgi:fucose permease
MASTHTLFTRDRFTWQAYLGLAYFAYFQAALGPLMPFLRDELRLSYTVGGLHFSAFALGMMLAGSIGDLVAAKWGRYRTFWGGGIGMVIGIILFSLGQTVAVTIISAFLMGSLGALVLVMVQSTLSDQHGDNRAVALTEANILASVAASMAPFLVGGFQLISIGWRGGILIAILWWGSMIALFGREQLPKMQVDTSESTNKKPRRKLPMIYWYYWIIIFLGVSVEWSIGFWGADFLNVDVGLSRENAVTFLSVFFIASIIGRIIGSRLTHFLPMASLLLIATIISIVGFLLYWQSPIKSLNIAGLFVTGIGISNVFPICLSISSSVVTPAQSDIASGRISLGAGAAILIAPQILGVVADQTSIRTAYVIVLVLLIFAVGMTIIANRASAST